MGNQNSGNVAVSHPPPNWTQSFPRDHKKLKKYGVLSENKVLPQRIPGQRLRPTENGHVLQTKGTINAKRMSEFHAPHHPAFPPPLNLQQPNKLHHPLHLPHSASMTALHHPPINDERAAFIHDIRFGRPPSKTYASEPDLRGPTPSMPVPVPQLHTIISESPTKGKIKSKKKYKAPPVPQGGMGETYSPSGERSYSVSDVALQSSHNQMPHHYGVHWAGQLVSPPSASPEAQKPKTRKMGLFRKKNESRRISSEENYISNDEPDRGRAMSEERNAAASPIQRSPREELRERARSLDCLQYELRQSPISHAVPVAATSLTHLHQPQEPRLWTTLERDSRRSLPHEVERRSSTIERESRKNSSGERESKRSITFDRDQHRSHRRLSTLERKVEERKQWANDGRENTSQSSSKHISRLDSYRDSSHRRSSSNGSHHELIPEEVGKSEIKDEWDRAEAEMVQKKKENENRKMDDWGLAEAKINQRKKMSASLQAELISTVNNLKKPVEQEQSTSTLTRKSKEGGKNSHKPSSRPSSSSGIVVTQMESQPKTFFFGMEPEVSNTTRGETNTGLHKIKNQEEIAKINEQEEVHISGQTVEYSRRTLERTEKHQARNHSTRKESHNIKEIQQKSSNETESHKQQTHTDRRKLSKDVEDFAVAIERHKMNRADGESGASGSSRREDGGYHSRQNSGSLYLDNEQEGPDGELSLNLRPTLPRRQLEIPRFSPNAAWRSLSLERASRNANTLDESRSSEEPDSVYEARIQRFTRPTAPPRGTGEKSADSGISGDAGSPGPTHEFEPLTPPEKNKSSSGPLAASSPVTSGRQEVRRAWTPAQDLDDNSLDGSGEPPVIHVSEGLSTPPKLTSRSNMFAKSQEITNELETELDSPNETELDSPNETEPISELISSDKKDHWARRMKKNGADIFPQKFNSLRKLKRSVSGAITVLGRKSPGADDPFQGKPPEDAQLLQQGDESNWRDNWSMSRSIPNSLNTCEEQETVSNLSSSRNIRSRSESRLIAGAGAGEVLEEPRSRTPSYLQHGNSGHIMYLPQYNSRRKPIEEGSEKQHHTSLQQDIHQERRLDLHHAVRPLTPEHERKPPSGDEDPAQPESYHGPNSLPNSLPIHQPILYKKAKGKKFSYQSTVRILEKKKLEEKLSREVAQKERQRIKEIEAMKKVEEEFQKKREREKKRLKQQLKLFNIQNQQQQNHLQSNRDHHDHSYSSDEQVPSPYALERHEVSSQDSSYNPPSLPRAPPPQVYPAFTSLPSELPVEASPGILSGLKSWVRGRRESRSSSTSTLTSAPRQEPDGAPASSPRKSSDDYDVSASSSQKNSDENSDQMKPDFRAEIIAASKKRNAKAQIYQENLSSKYGQSQPHRSSYSPDGDDIERVVPQISSHPQTRHQEPGYHQAHPKRAGKSRPRDDPRRSVSPDNRRLSQVMMQELPEFHQERREYREYRSSSRRSHSPPARTTNSPPSSIAPSKSSNYRRDFCRGNAQLIGPNVVSVKVKRTTDEIDRHSKHSSDDRRSVASSGVQRSASAELLDSASCSSSSTSRYHTRHQSSHNFTDGSLSQNYNRMNGYPPVDSSPARFAHNMLTPFNAPKGYKPVSFSPPPPTKILHVN